MPNSEADSVLIQGLSRIAVKVLAEVNSLLEGELAIDWAMIENKSLPSRSFHFRNELFEQYICSTF